MVSLGSRTRKGSFTGGATGSGGMSGSAAMPQFRPGKGRRRGGRSKFVLNDPMWSNAIGKAHMAGLKAQGGWIRVTARRSIRYHKDPLHKSNVGKPPRSHTQSKRVTVRNIQYDYFPANRMLFVGSVWLKRSYGMTTVPSVHEHGRRVSARRSVNSNRPIRQRSPEQQRAWRRMQLQGHKRVQEHKAKQQQQRRVIRTVSLNYPPRPFMQPALDKGIRTGALSKWYAKGFNNAWR